MEIEKKSGKVLTWWIKIFIEIHLNALLDVESCRWNAIGDYKKIIELIIFQSHNFSICKNFNLFTRTMELEHHMYFFVCLQEMQKVSTCKGTKSTSNSRMQKLKNFYRHAYKKVFLRYKLLLIGSIQWTFSSTFTYHNNF
jgi:hypothetical protein